MSDAESSDSWEEENPYTESTSQWYRDEPTKDELEKLILSRTTKTKELEHAVDKMKRYNVILQQWFNDSRSKTGKHNLPVWCQCGCCDLQNTPRENFCCMDVWYSKSAGAQKIKEKMSTQSPLGVVCLSTEPKVAEMCFKYEFLRVLALSRVADKREKVIEPLNPRLIRNMAYRSFTFWVHGTLGAGVRREIPSCVVAAIRKKFPGGGQYTGFLPGEAKFLAEFDYDEVPGTADDSELLF